MTVLIDSWAWIEYFRGTGKGKKVVPLIESGEELLVSALNIAEVYHAILKKRGKDEAERHREAMLSRCRVVNVNADIAAKGAEIKLEKKWGLADAIILATAEGENARILTGDPHFKGLRSVEFIGE